MVDISLENIEKRLESCLKKENQLNEHLKVIDDEKERENIENQLEKLDQLIKHLNEERMKLL